MPACGRGLLTGPPFRAAWKSTRSASRQSVRLRLPRTPSSAEHSRVEEIKNRSRSQISASCAASRSSEARPAHRLTRAGFEVESCGCGEPGCLRDASCRDHLTRYLGLDNQPASYASDTGETERCLPRRRRGSYARRKTESRRKERCISRALGASRPNRAGLRRAVVDVSPSSDVTLMPCFSL